MRLKQNTVNINSSGISKDGYFGIKSGDESHIFSILRSRLYTDKILAVIREYTTNAIDAHTEVGKGDIPIDVTLPTQLDSVFIVRDYGPGLTEEEIFEVYTKYGRSTKRETNNTIGALGIGCKSAFCYVDAFTIESFIDGKHTTYSAYIDETNIGKVAKMQECETEESNGIKISIPVNTDDIFEFKTKAERLFFAFNVKPNCPQIDYEDTPLFLTYQSDQISFYTLEKQGYGRYKTYNPGIYARMGGVMYRIDRNASEKISDMIRDVYSSIILLDFEIGDLEVSASREGLEYTDNTIDSIVNRLNEIILSVKEDLRQQIKEAKKVQSARYIYAKTELMLQNIFINLDIPKYKKARVDITARRLPAEIYFKYLNESKTGRFTAKADSTVANLSRYIGDYINGTPVRGTHPPVTVLIEVDNEVSYVKKGVQILQETREKYKTDYVNVYFLFFDNDEQKQKLVNDHIIHPSEIIKASEIILPKGQRKTRTHINSLSQIFRGEYEQTDGYYPIIRKTLPTSKSDNGYYIPFHRNKVVLAGTTKEVTSSDTKYMVNKLIEVGILKEDDRIFFVRTNHCNKLDGWENVQTLYFDFILKNKQYIDESLINKVSEEIYGIVIYKEISVYIKDMITKLKDPDLKLFLGKCLAPILNIRKQVVPKDHILLSRYIDKDFNHLVEEARKEIERQREIVLQEIREYTHRYPLLIPLFCSDIHITRYFNKTFEIGREEAIGTIELTLCDNRRPKDRESDLNQNNSRYFDTLVENINKTFDTSNKE